MVLEYFKGFVIDIGFSLGSFVVFVGVCVEDFLIFLLFKGLSLYEKLSFCKFGFLLKCLFSKVVRLLENLGIEVVS